MTVESFRGFTTAIVAGLLALISLILAFVAWLQPVDPNNPRELALIFGFLGTAFGSSTGYLFAQESANRASRAAERAHAASHTTIAGT
jgi:hypothetical protein